MCDHTYNEVSDICQNMSIEEEDMKQGHRILLWLCI